MDLKWGIWTAFRPREGRIWTKIFQKFKCPGDCPGGMFKLRFDWYIKAENRLHDTWSRNMWNLFPQKSILSVLRDFITCLWRDMQITALTIIINQITLLLPVRGRTEFGKMFDCRRFLFSPLPTPSPSRSPPPYFSLSFSSTQACSFAYPLFRLFVRSPPGKRKKTAATQAIPCRVTGSILPACFEILVLGIRFLLFRGQVSMLCVMFFDWTGQTP